MTVEKLKTAISYIHSTIGVPYQIIASKSKMSGTHLSLWLKGEKNLSDEAFERVKNYYETFISEVTQIL